MAERKAATASSKGQVKSLTSQWGGQIRKRVERRKIDPRAAAGAEGSVGLRLTVTHGGALAGVSVARSSGNATLDAAAVQAVSRAGSFPPVPKGLTDAQYSFTLAVSFKNSPRRGFLRFSNKSGANVTTGRRTASHPGKIKTKERS
ncbi:energy transducer TonB family protein [Cypionkella psychrotolerans]|uniref:energy transducer TonB family protein n=1 Tax=Cypionkella psychrotolerans TaxID=1678131 RepID=UPI0006B630E3|nr:TonB family protein [Cypionkella psychrotolerans]